MLYFYGCYDSDSFYPCTEYIHWCNAGKKEKKRGGGGGGQRNASTAEYAGGGNILDRVRDDIYQTGLDTI